MRHLFVILTLGFSRCILAATGDIDIKLLSPDVLVGETTQLLIRVEGTERAFIGTLPESEEVQLKLEETTSPVRGAVRDTLFRLSIRALKEGNLQIPQIPIEVLGQEKKSPARTIGALSTDVLNWATETLQEYEVEYATRWSIANNRLYAGESTPISLHVYLPRLAGTGKLAYPRDRSTGLAVGPLLPTDPYKPDDEPIGQTLLRGRIYDIFVFSARATAIATGKLSLGPATAPAILRVRRTVTTQEMNFSLEASLPIPAAEIKGLPFPSRPPKGFDGAIGDFRLLARTRANKIIAGAPVEIEVSVEGSGNFADLPTPRVSDPGAWKIASVRRLGSENSKSQSPAKFQYLLTHPETPSQAPAFELTSFSPINQKFETVTTPQIPLLWEGETANNRSLTELQESSKNNANPFEKITLRKHSPSFFSEQSKPFWWSWTIAIAASLPLCVLFGMGLLRRHRIKHPESILIEKIRLISKTSDTKEYLRQIGRILEDNLPEAKRPREAQELIELRNEHCFRPESMDFSISKQQRREWIKKISRALSTLAILVCICGTKLQAAEETPSSDELINTGSQFAQEQDWSRAAICFRQALVAEPSNQQAKKRLDLVHQSAGTLLPEANFWKSSLGKLRRITYLQIGVIVSFIGLYALALAFASGRKWRSANSLFSACLILAAFAIHTYSKYPGHYSQSDLDSRALLTNTSTLHELPLENSKAHSLPPATPVLVVARRLPWLFVESPDGKNYWIKEDAVLPLEQLASQ